MCYIIYIIYTRIYQMPFWKNTDGLTYLLIDLRTQLHKSSLRQHGHVKRVQVVPLLSGSIAMNKTNGLASSEARRRTRAHRPNR